MLDPDGSLENAPASSGCHLFQVFRSRWDLPLLRLSECLSVLACKLPGIKAICRELWKDSSDATG